MTTGAAPLAEKSAARRKLPSPVWLAPIFAVLLAGAVATASILERGPLVEIRFKSAKGVKAEKTHILYKDVIVGEVEAVELSDDLESVIVKARLEKAMAPYIGDTTQFWVVSASVNGAQVSGLNTLLSGAYIEMDWTGKPTQSLRKIDGLDTPPLTDPGTPGRRVTLVSNRGGGLSVGSSVFYRQLAAGRIESRSLTDDGQRVVFTAFVDAPYDRFISTETKFWNVSGLEVEAGAEGVVLNVESLSALLSGGVAFGGLADQQGAPVNDGASFTLFPTRKDAEESLFALEGDEEFLYIVEFSESVSGLKAGAPVQYEGIIVGRVVDVVADADPSVVGPPRIYVVVRIEPARLTKEEIDAEELRSILNGLVERGLRMQLTVGNVLSGSLSVQMILAPDAEPTVIDYDAVPYPALPTAPSEITAIAADVEDIIASLAALPLEDLVVAMTSLLTETERFISSPSFSALPGDVAELAKVITIFTRQAEDAIQGLNPDSELYLELTAATAELRDASRAVARLAERLEEQPNSLITGRN